MTNTDSEIKAPWLAMIIIAMGQALMSFNVAALPVSMGGMVESFNTPPTTVGTAQAKPLAPCCVPSLGNASVRRYFSRLRYQCFWWQWSAW